MGLFGCDIYRYCRATNCGCRAQLRCAGNHDSVFQCKKKVETRGLTMLAAIKLRTPPSTCTLVIDEKAWSTLLKHCSNVLLFPERIPESVVLSFIHVTIYLQQ